MIAFTNSTVLILDFYILLSFWFHVMDFEESSYYSQFPGNLSPDYKYLHARKIPHKLNFTSQAISDL